MKKMTQPASQKLNAQWQDSAKRFKQLPPVASFNAWYDSQNKRDQKIIKAVSLFIAFCLIVVMFVQPFLAKQTLYQAKLNKSLATYQVLADNAHKFQGQITGKASDGPILAIVTGQAKRAQINLKRFEPDGDGLRVWLEDAVFDDAMRWLEALNQENGILIKQINVDRSDQPGRVDLRGTLYK